MASLQQSSSVEARDVSVVVDGYSLLAPVSLTVPAAGAVAVRGPNGSGKTTLLRVLAGLTRPSSGTVLIENRAVDARNRHFRSSVAALIDSPPLARDLTLDEHLAFVAATWGASNADARAQASTWLERFAINRLADRFVSELSSGQRQLFLLALTLIRPSSVLLLDEPEQRLDADRLALVMTALAERRAGGTALIVATHSDVVEQFADETLVIGPA